jgi:hypothetical protein
MDARATQTTYGLQLWRKQQVFSNVDPGRYASFDLDRIPSRVPVTKYRYADGCAPRERGEPSGSLARAQLYKPIPLFAACQLGDTLPDCIRTLRRRTLQAANTAP